MNGFHPESFVFCAGGGKPDTKFFNSYSHALKVCGPGYDDDLIADVVVTKTDVFQRNLQHGQPRLDLGSFRTLIAMGFAEKRNPLRILDFGGAAGYHYFIARLAAESHTRLDWRVVETTSMATAAGRLANEELSFFSSIKDAVTTWEGPPDLVFASGVLMYVPDPLDTFGRLLSLQANRVFVTRTGLSPDATTRFMVQKSKLSTNGPGPLPPGALDKEVTYPNTFIPITAFEQLITSSGYNIIAQINEDTAVWRAGNTPINQYGYLCQFN
jgi:putative methyltransferase (TIGR04325 family)